MGPSIKLEGARLLPRPWLDGGEAPRPVAFRGRATLLPGSVPGRATRRRDPNPSEDEEAQARSPNSSQLVALL